MSFSACLSRILRNRERNGMVLQIKFDRRIDLNACDSGFRLQACQQSVISEVAKEEATL